MTAWVSTCSGVSPPSSTVVSRRAKRCGRVRSSTVIAGNQLCGFFCRADRATTPTISASNFASAWSIASSSAAYSGYFAGCSRPSFSHSKPVSSWIPASRKAIER
jgi:hypothetical protein